MLDYSEKRDFPRMHVDCAARYRLEGSASVDSAIARDLSGGGLLLRVDRELLVGSRIDIEIQPGTDITPPFYASAEVIRCDQVDGGFNAACRIVKVLTEDDVAQAFPAAV